MILLLIYSYSLGKLRERGISVYFTFVRRHVGIYGNERVDWLSKNATKKNINVDVNVPKSYLKNTFKFETVEKWNREYLTIDKGDIAKMFFPIISEWLKNKHFLLIFSCYGIFVRTWKFQKLSRAFEISVFKCVFL